MAAMMAGKMAAQMAVTKVLLTVASKAVQTTGSMVE